MISSTFNDYSNLCAIYIIFDPKKIPCMHIFDKYMLFIVRIVLLEDHSSDGDGYIPRITGHAGTVLSFSV